MKRLVTRLAAVALLASAMFFPAVEGFVFRADPLLGLVWLAGGAKSPTAVRAAQMVITAAVVVLSLFVRRFWCRWLCPFGLVLDGCRFCARRCVRPRLTRLGVAGEVIGFAALALALFGGVGLLWLDPLVLFLALVHGGKGAAVAFVWALFVLAATFFFPAFWCAGLCPAGGVSELLYKMGTPLRRLLSRRKTSAGAEKSVSPGTQYPPRRPFLRRIAGGAAAFFAGAAVFLRLGRMARGAAPAVRPPGAVKDDLFLARCARCGQCIRSCPQKVLRPSRGQWDVGTPVADFALGCCDDQCDRCAAVCPSGAIVPLTAERRLARPMSVIRLHLDGCRLWYDRECHLCLTECPAGAIHYRWNQEEYLQLPEIDPARCSGCGRCVHYCPGYNGRKGLVALPPEETPPLNESK
ncbi:MAG: 4Fe-4S binding protein [Thermoguttaceae bacterium]|nr:4Fe-4S binding protein [Thermoguttaceae bacterium]